MVNEKVGHKWLSAVAYAKQTGLGVEEVKKMIRNGELKGHITENDGAFSKYYVKVGIDGEESVPREKYDEVVSELAKYKACQEALLKILT